MSDNELLKICLHVSIFIVFIVYIIITPIFVTKYNKLKQYEQGLCYSSECDIDQGSCRKYDDTCWILYCEYTIIEPVNYANFSKYVKPYNNEEKIKVEYQLSQRNNSIQSCFVKSDDIKPRDPDAQYYKDAVIEYTISIIALFSIVILWSMFSCARQAYKDSIRNSGSDGSYQRY